MTTPNNLNTDPVVLNDVNVSHGNGNAQFATGNGSASGPTVQEHAVNAKNSLINCEVRRAESWNSIPLRACRAAANQQNQSYRTVPTHVTRNSS